MRNAILEETQAGIKIARRNINIEADGIGYGSQRTMQGSLPERATDSWANVLWLREERNRLS